jgi:predicted phosphodiesterase
MKLRKKKRLFNLLKRYEIDLVLHGHFHEMGEYKREGIRFLNAGGSLKNNSKNLIGINFINISQTSKITTYTVDLKYDQSDYKSEKMKQKSEETNGVIIPQLTEV